MDRILGDGESLPPFLDPGECEPPLFGDREPPLFGDREFDFERLVLSCLGEVDGLRLLTLAEILKRFCPLGGRLLLPPTSRGLRDSDFAACGERVGVRLLELLFLLLGGETGSIAGVRRRASPVPVPVAGAVPCLDSIFCCDSGISMDTCPSLVSDMTVKDAYLLSVVKLPWVLDGKELN